MFIALLIATAGLAAEPAPTVEVAADTLTAPTLWAAGGVQPVGAGGADRYIVGGSAEGWLTGVVGVEASFLVNIPTNNRVLTQQLSLFAPGPITGLLSEPRWQADGRLQLRVFRGEFQSFRRQIPLWAGVNVGAGAVNTRDDSRLLACDMREGDPCTKTAIETHFTPVIGASFGLAPSGATRIRAGVSWNTWRENLNGDTREMMSRTTLTLAFGAALPQRDRPAGSDDGPMDDEPTDEKPFDEEPPNDL